MLSHQPHSKVLNLASLKYKQMWAFYQNISFSARKRPLEALVSGTRSREFARLWSPVKIFIISYH